MRYTGDFDTLPETIQPYWEGISVDAPLPAVFEFAVLNKWVNGDGDWLLGFRIEAPEDVQFAQTSNEAYHHFAGEDDPPFFHYVVIRLRLPVAGTYWFVVDCNGEAVLRYPMTLQSEGSWT
jgi:hypothetical protein